MGGEIVPGVERVAVVRANALGDLLFSLPALESLRAAYPDAEIVLLGQEWHRRFLTGRPGPVDRVEVIPGPVAVHPDNEPFLARMRAEHFDLALQIHGGGRHSNPFTTALGARLTAGLRATDAEALDRWTRYVPRQHEPSRHLETVALVGGRWRQPDPHVAVTQADRTEASAALGPAAGPFAVFHPGANDPRRRWPPERFAAVGDHLAGADVRVVVTGTSDEGDVTAAVLANMASPAVDLAGKLSIGGLTGLLAGASVVVANDTGPLHLAAAVGTPSVGIYWWGNLLNGGPVTRSLHRPCCSLTTACPMCGVDNGQARCAHDPSFVADVPADEVIAEAVDLLYGPLSDGRA